MSIRRLALLLPALLLVAFCRGPGVPLSDLELREILKLSPVPPPPLDPTNSVAASPAAARLGQRLFFDGRLSSSGEVSCATCHDPRLGFTTRDAKARGLKTVHRNAPGLLNVSHGRWFFWDGRADSLWAQALVPIEVPEEMGGSRLGVARLIASDPVLKAGYEEVFGNLPPEPSFESEKVVSRIFANAGKSIAAYERLLSTRGDAPFDRFVLGLRTKDRALVKELPENALRGARLFVGRGRCTLCHGGPLFTDREFHNIGLSRGDVRPLDDGRFSGVDIVLQDPFNAAGELSDDRGPEASKKLTFLARRANNLGEFKTPSLRNVAETAPYMHDGRFATLGEVLRFYSLLAEEPAMGHREESLKPLHLSPEEMADLEAFLVSLTGKPLPQSLLRRPD